MYKLIFFLNKTDDESVIEHFRTQTLNLINNISGSEIKIGKVDSNLLLENKYSYCCELIASSKEKLAQMMSTSQGKKLGKDMLDFHKHLTVISLDYGNNE